MKRYFFISLLMHCLPLVFLLIHLNLVDELKVENQNSQQKTNNNIQIEVVEKEPALSEAPLKKELPKNFYWGIGISVEYPMLQIPGFIGDIRTTRIEKVYKGYCAEEAGLMVGDIIYLINGDLITPNNDIVGDGPKKLILTILRNGITVRVSLERCKVYY